MIRINTAATADNTVHTAANTAAALGRVKWVHVQGVVDGPVGRHGPLSGQRFQPSKAALTGEWMGVATEEGVAGVKAPEVGVGPAGIKLLFIHFIEINFLGLFLIKTSVQNLSCGPDLKSHCSIQKGAEYHHLTQNFELYNVQDQKFTRKSSKQNKG